MKKTLLILLVFLIISSLNAQVNIVPNGDFEIYSLLPNAYGQSNRATGWNNVNLNYSATTTSSPDYYNTLSFNTGNATPLIPYSGNGQMGICTYNTSMVNLREYISSQLTTAMIPGHVYTISFYLTNGTGLGDYKKGTNRFGIRFSMNSWFQATYEPINVIPQYEIQSVLYITNSWQHFTFNFTADSAYQIITIGNFRNDANTTINTYGSNAYGAYYFIDKIETIPVKIKLVGDSVICAGNSATIKTVGDSIVKWANVLTPNNIITIDSMLTVMPTINTTYMAFTSYDTAYYTVHVYNPPTVNLGNDTSFCQGNSLILNAGNAGANYLWNTGATTQQITVSTTATYSVKVTNSIGCVGRDTINVTVIPRPLVNLGNDTSTCQAISINLNAGNTGSTYLWSTGATTQQISVTNVGTYWVNVTNASACVGRDTINISYLNPVANFSIPDTICVNTSFNIQNLTTCGSTYYWNFCSGNLSTNPIGLNMGNLGSLSRPVYSAIAKDGNNFYVFITNNWDGTLSRLAFGNSLTNTPVATNLGTLGVMGMYVEGIQVKKDGNGNWYGLILGGQNNYLGRMNFGTSLANTPTMVSLGNIGNTFNLPHTLYLFQENNNWYGLVCNSNSSTIVRLNFGTSLANTPTAVNLGNIGILSTPVGMFPILDNGTWYLFVVNRDNNSLSRLNFGTSLLNTPTGTNLGNVGGTMNYPRSITILRDCGQVFGFVVNEGTSDLVRLTFSGGLTTTPTGVSLGNNANYSFPHQLSELFRAGDSLFTFVTNVNNNTISRLCFTSCTNASVPSSNLFTPPTVSYNLPGTYNINLTVNEGLPSQTNKCKQIVVLGSPHDSITGTTIVCVGDSIKLFPNTPTGCTYQWTGPNGFTSTNQNINVSNANITNKGYYKLTVSKNGCVGKDSIYVNVVAKPTVNLGNDTSICLGFNVTLNAQNPGLSYLWSTNATTQQISVTNPGTYWVKVTNSNGCFGRDTIAISNYPLPNVNLGNDTTLCIGSQLTLNAANTGSTYLWSNNLTTQQINITASGIYSVRVTNSNGCIGRDTILVNFISDPTVNLGNDTSICQGNTVTLSAQNPGLTYLWSTFANTQQINVNASGSYWVKVTNNSGCIGRDTLNVTIIPNPIVNLGNDTTLCVGSSLTLDAGIAGATYLWSTNATTQQINISASGNYWVKVTNSNGCIGLDTIKVSFTSFNVNIGNDTTICQGDTITLNAGNPGSTYLWNTGFNTQIIKVWTAGPYWVYVLNGSCNNSDTINIIVDIKPVINLGNDTLMCPGDLILLNAGSGYSSYLWSTGSTQPILNIISPGTYSVTVHNGSCVASDEIIVNECNSEIWIPNVFTPNGDGTNETFYPVCTNIDEIKMYIFNRWGNLIFEGKGKAAVWDGTYKGNICPDGVYYYLIEYIQKLNNNIGMKQLHGSISLLR